MIKTWKLNIRSVTDASFYFFFGLSYQTVAMSTDHSTSCMPCILLD